MNILDVIMNAREGAAVRQLGSQVGLGEKETTAALSALVPALATGFQRNLQTSDGLAGLVSALAAGNHQRYIDDPAALADQGAIADGGSRPKVFALASSDADVAEAERLGCDVILREPHQVRALYDALLEVQRQAD